MSSRRRWLWVLSIGLAGIFGSLIAGFTDVADKLLSTAALTPLLLNKQIVFGITLVVSFAVVGIAQHMLAKINREEVTHHIR